MEKIINRLHIITDKQKAIILLSETLKENNIEEIIFYESSESFLSAPFSTLESQNSRGIPEVILIDTDPQDTFFTDLDELRDHTGIEESLVLSFSINPTEKNDFLSWGADGAFQLPFNGSDLLDFAEESIGSQACRDEEVILFIDDSNLIHKMVDTIITPQGYRLEHAYDGIEGILKAEELIPDLIITDIEMPKLDGYGVCKKIKENEKLQSIPVLIQSSITDGMHIDKAFESGADDYITKPINPAELISRINSFLNSVPENRETILVADSSRLITNMIVTGLKKQGFQCITANSGSEIIELAHEHQIDLFIISQVLHVMDGREVVRTLRKDPATKSCPVIMLSSKDSKLDLIKNRSAGVSEFISKPFVVERMLVAVEKLLGEYRFIKERDAMSMYISEAAMDHAGHLAKSGSPLTMRAEEKYRTILFTDIVGFTPLCESLTPETVINLLNGYFDLMVDIIRNNGGTIDKFIGDAVMAIYGGKENGAYMAVKTGIEMIEALAEFNKTAIKPIHIRVGINSGEVVQGDLGSRFFRRDYTIIGDAVNVAQRLESSAPCDSVLVSDSTWELIEGSFSAEAQEPIALKGKEEMVNTHLIKGKISQLV
ncbi:MAG: response regulator [Spirochaetales bacterium]|nr:response regulator [Spirochaetales bacterium]